MLARLGSDREILEVVVGWGGPPARSGDGQVAADDPSDGGDHDEDDASIEANELCQCDAKRDGKDTCDSGDAHG